MEQGLRTPFLIPLTSKAGETPLTSCFPPTSPWVSQCNFLTALRLLKLKNQKGKCPASNFCFLPTLRQGQNLAPYLNEGR